MGPGHECEGLSRARYLGVGRPTHCAWHHALGWEPKLKEEVNGTHVLVTLCFLTGDVTLTTAPSSCDFLVMDSSWVCEPDKPLLPQTAFVQTILSQP